MKTKNYNIMKKAFLLIASAAILFAGCKKEQPLASDGETTVVTVCAGLEGAATKAADDLDGNAAKVNHWVFEVLDANGKLFYREVSTPEAGTKSQTYNISLIKNQDYDLLFWADNSEGFYKTDNLKEVSLVMEDGFYEANRDSRDAFCAHKKCKADGSAISVKLTRPFAQINLITTDLADLWTQAEKSGDQESVYASNKPVDFVAKIKVPTTFNVLTESYVKSSEEFVVMKADNCYVAYKEDLITAQDKTNYLLHTNPATLYMDYIFATSGEEADVVKIDFSFKSNSKAVNYTFSNIPVKANYRTNIKGQLMSNDTRITVTIDPTWADPDYNK